MAAYLRDLTDMAALVSQDFTDLVLEDVLPRLTPADLLRAAVACHSWRRAAVNAIPRVLPVRGYYLHPVGQPLHRAEFRRLTNASSTQRLSIPRWRYFSNYSVQDVHLGVILLLPPSWARFPTIIAFDPASRHEATLRMPSLDVLPLNDPCTCFLGAAILSRAHPSRLTFDAVCLTAHGQRKRAWIVSVVNGNLDGPWLPWPKPLGVVIDFDPKLIERRGVHAAGNIYWHIAGSNRVLELDPRTMDFSFLTVPDNLEEMFGVAHYRIGETPEDGCLCLVSLRDDESLQIWVRGGDPRSDNGWFLQRDFLLSRLFDAVPNIPIDGWLRMRRLSVLDIDPHRTGKVFIYASGCGRYYFDLETRRLEISTLNGHPVYAYTMPWPPEFLTPHQTDNVEVDQ